MSWADASTNEGDSDPSEVEDGLHATVPGRHVAVGVRAEAADGRAIEARIGQAEKADRVEAHAGADEEIFQEEHFEKDDGEATVFAIGKVKLSVGDDVGRTYWNELRPAHCRIGQGCHFAEGRLANIASRVKCQGPLRAPDPPGGVGSRPSSQVHA